MAHRHRPTGLKQTNKPFKGGSSSGGSKGRTEKKTKQSHKVKNLSKNDRRHQALQQVAAKRAVLQAERKQMQGREGVGRLVVMLPVSERVDLARLLAALAGERPLLPSSTWPQAFCSLYSEGQRLRLAFMALSQLDASALMHLAMADVILLVAHEQDAAVTAPFAELAGLLRAQGVPALCACLQTTLPEHDGEQVQPGDFKQGDSRQVRAYWQRLLEEHLPVEQPIRLASPELERSLATVRLHTPRWLADRPYLLAETAVGGEAAGQIFLEGFIRGGKPLSAQRLVHLPDLNLTLPIDRIEGGQQEAEERDPMQAESLDTALAIPVEDEEEDQEALWWAQEEMLNAEEEEEKKKKKTTKSVKKRRVPKGTSAYQAAWIAESDLDSFDDESHGTASDDDAHSAAEIENTEMESSKEVQFDSTVDFNAEEDLAGGEEAAVEAKALGRRHFADAVEVPPELSARERFARYRGLASLRRGEWDAEEGLPREYGRIYRFANWKCSQARAMAEDASTPWQLGQRVRLYLTLPPGVTISPEKPLAVIGLHRHEQRVSLLNMTVQATAAIKHKEPLVAIIGPRRFVITPIWSELNPQAALHKRLSVVPAGGMAVATAYLPISFGTPCPVLLFNQAGALVAQGSVSDCNPNRIILKRITLCATPFRVNKRTVVARFMFNNPADIYWFKPVELVTKSGKRGHIIESLGTHGYMKCLFDQQLQHGEVIGMHLYKRVYPKWPSA